MGPSTPQSDLRSTTSLSSAPGPKLRDSCHACASSKVKCSKEKPTCARCAKRGRQCQYFVTRRVGRSQSNRSKNLSGSLAQDHSLTPNTGSGIPVADETMSRTPRDILGPNSTSDSIQVILDSYATAFTDADASSVHHASEAQELFDVTLSDYLTSPIDFDISDLATIDNGTGSNTHGLTSNHSHSHSIDSAITESLPDANASIFGFDIGDSPSPAAIIPYQQPHSAAADTAADVSSQDLALTLYTSLATNSTGAASDSDPPCGCHSRALETLKQLCSSSIHSPTDSTSSKSQGSQLARSLQGVIDANERVLETVGKMVPCTCSRDGFLLAILSMIAFKVMARYEAAARRRHHFLEPNLRSSFSASSTSLSSTASSMLGGDAMERKASGSGASGGEEHDDRMAARVVLSELYRVQRFVKGFSKRVKQIASLEGGERDYHISLSGHRPTHSGSGAGDVVMGGCSDEVSLPFSPALYHQLEADLRRRLRGLSADIADLVRTA